MRAPMSPHPDRLILIHGAWQGAWAWAALLRQLAKLGVDAQALDLPGNGHHSIPAHLATEADYLNAVEHAILTAPGNVILVGHSGGGMLATAGAEAYPDRVSAAVYIAGFLLPEGRNFGAVQRAIAPKLGAFGVTPHIKTSADGLTCSVSATAAIAHFYHDAPPDIAKAAAAQLTPQSLAGHRLSVQTSPDRFGRVPKIYIEAAQDRSIPLQAQRLMQGYVDQISVISMETGHAPQLVAPATLARHLADLARPTNQPSHSE